MDDVLVLFLVAVVLLAGIIVLPQFMVRRTIPSVIKLFRQHNALGASNARTMEELGFTSQTLMDKMWKPRDYKPRALQLLINANIVQMTPEGKLYLSEENLTATKWGKRQI